MSITPAADPMSYVPNPYFSADDIYPINDTTVLIDLSRDTPSPQALLAAEIFDNWSDTSEAGDKYVPDDYVADADGTLVPFEPELRYTLQNVVDRTYLVAGDGALKGNLAVFFGGTEHDGRYAPYESCYTQLPNGQYSIRPHYRKFFSDRLVGCAGLIATALNDQHVDNRSFHAGFISVTVSAAAMKESNIHFTPSILLFLSRGWMVPAREFTTTAEIKQHIDHFFSIICFAAALYTKLMITTIRLGTESLCNAGAGIGMSKGEFIGQAGCPNAYTDFVESWIDKMLNDVKYVHDADDAAGAFFGERPITYLLDVEDSEDYHDGWTMTLLPHTPHETTTNAPFTQRIRTTPAKLGLQLAMIGF